MDGKDAEDEVGVLCGKRSVEVDKIFGASAIGSLLELWQLIFADTRRTCLQKRLDTTNVSTDLSSTAYLRHR